MIEQFEIANFKKFKKPVHIDNLSRINIIVGNNGIGKTTLLDSLFMYNFLVSQWSHQEDEPYDRLDCQRWYRSGLLTGSIVHLQFPLNKNYTDIPDCKNPYKDELAQYKAWHTYVPPLCGCADSSMAVRSLTSSGHRSLDSWDFKKQPEYDYDRYEAMRLAFNINAMLADTFGANVGEIGRWIKNPKHDPELPDEKKLYLTKRWSNSTEFGLRTPSGEIVDFRKTNLGVQKFCEIFLQMPCFAGKLVTIDEIDTGFNPVTFEKISKYLIQYACAFHLQVFCVTHSWDFIEAMLKAANMPGIKFKDLRLIEMLPADNYEAAKNGEVSIATYNANQATKWLKNVKSALSLEKD